MEKDAAKGNPGHITPGEARLSISVRPDMADGYGIYHGGFIFSLADSRCCFRVHQQHPDLCGATEPDHLTWSVCRWAPL